MDFFEFFQQNQISKEEKYKLLRKYREEGCLQSKKKLILSFMPMALKLCVKFSEKYDFPVAELFNESYIIINEAIERFDEERAELSTFVYHMLQWNLKAYIGMYFTPVKYPSSVKKKMKSLSISMNPIYISEICPDMIIYKTTPEIDLILKEEEEDDG